MRQSCRRSNEKMGYHLGSRVLRCKGQLVVEFRGAYVKSKLMCALLPPQTSRAAGVGPARAFKDKKAEGSELPYTNRVLANL